MFSYSSDSCPAVLYANLESIQPADMALAH